MFKVGVVCFIFLLNSVWAVESDHPCFKELPLFCKGITQPETGHWACLGEKMNLLNGKCKEFMRNNYLENNDCGSDILTYCVGKDQNYGKWVPCLGKRKKNLKKKCLDLITKIQSREKLWTKLDTLCSDDAYKYCGGKKHVDRTCRKNLESDHLEKLDPACAKIIQSIK